MAKGIKELIEDFKVLHPMAYKKIQSDAIEECAMEIEKSKTLFENHQTECVMRTKDRCISLIRNLKELKEN